MALAEKLLAAEFNRPGFDIVDHRTYVFVGDGCLMEGISHEAASLAGTWRLEQADRDLRRQRHFDRRRCQGWFNDDTAPPLRGVRLERDRPGRRPRRRRGGSRDRGGQGETRRPTLIIARTVIGKGSPGRAGSEKAHGEALGEAEIAATRAAIGWPHAPFVVPNDVYAAWDARARGRRARGRRGTSGSRPTLEHFPREAAELDASRRGRPAARLLDATLGRCDRRRGGQARNGRHAQGIAAGARGPCAGLARTARRLGRPHRQQPDQVEQGQGAAPDALDGRHINYGVREFGMSAIANGIALHGGFIPFVGTFLVFSDYARNAVRMSALMKQRVISSSRTTRSAWARMDRPTRPSNTRRACA